MVRIGVIVIVILVIVSFVLAAAFARAQGPDPRPPCWTAGQLRGTAGEIAPRPGAPGARVAPPLRTLAAFAATPAHLQGAIRRVVLPEGKKLVALTFDLCEAGHEIAGYDGRVMDYLRAHGVRATFFAGGKWLLTHPARAEQLVADPLFEVASHGWRHGNFRALAGQALHDEIAYAQAAYEEVRERLSARQCRAGAEPPERMTLLRFPYGVCTAAALRAAADAGLLAIQWDLAMGDPAPGRSARAIASTVLGGVRPGSIILGHANGRGWRTAQALPLFVPALRERGYDFVTVSELLAAGVPEIASACYDRQAGDTERWVAAARARPGRAASPNPVSGAGDGPNPFQQ